MRLTSGMLVLAGSALLGPGCTKRSAPLVELQPAAASTPVAAPVRGKMLDDLAQLAIGQREVGAAAAGQRAALERGEGTLEAYVDALLADARFSNGVAPDVLLTGAQRRLNSWAVPSKFILKSFQGPQGRVYHLRQPCRFEEAVEVSPWWAPHSRVRVCPDSYRPEVTGVAHTSLRCGGGALNPELSPVCGCGPQLLHCTVLRALSAARGARRTARDPARARRRAASGAAPRES